MYMLSSKDCRVTVMIKLLVATENIYLLIKQSPPSPAVQHGPGLVPSMCCLVSGANGLHDGFQEPCHGCVVCAAIRFSHSSQRPSAVVDQPCVAGIPSSWMNA